MDTGLKVLVEGLGGDGAVDIVFIHGLSGDYISTWTHKNNVCWIKDTNFLPHSFPAARIMSFKYDSGKIIEGMSQSITSLSKELLSALWTKRTKWQTSTSLSSNARKPSYFSAPHIEGSDAAEWASILAGITNTILGKPRNNLVNELQGESITIEAMLSNFRKFQSEWDIIAIVEKIPMAPGRKLVVSKDSAYLHLDNERFTELSENHENICKFESVESTGFDPPDLEERIRHSSEAVETAKGEKVKPKRFLLYGIGGSGKTQACCKLFNNENVRFQHRFWIDASTRESIEEGFSAIAQKADVRNALEWLESSDSSWLLVLDDFDFDNLLPDEFSPKVGDGLILISARRNVDSQWVDDSYRLEGLPVAESRSLLLKGTVKGLPSAQDNADATELVKLLGHLPLAINIASAHIRLWADDEPRGTNWIRRYINDWQSVFDHKAVGESRKVGATIQMTLEEIRRKGGTESADIIDLLKLLSFFHQYSISESIFAQALGVTKSRQVWVAGLENTTTNRDLLMDARYRTARGHLKQYCLLGSDAGFNRDHQDMERRPRSDYNVLSVHSLIAAYMRTNMDDAEYQSWIVKVANILVANLNAGDPGTDLLLHLTHLYNAASRQNGGQDHRPNDLIQVPCLFDVDDRLVYIPEKIANVFSKWGHFSKVICLREGVAARLEEFERSSPKTVQRLVLDVALSYKILSEAYDDDGRYQEALKARIKAKRLYERYHPPEHWDMLQCDEAIAKSLQHLNMAGDALSYHNRVIKTLSSRIPDQSANRKQVELEGLLPAYRSQARSLMQIGKVAQAEVILRYVLKQYSEFGVSEGHLDLLRCKALWGDALEMEGNHAAALIQRREVLKQRYQDDKHRPDTLLAKEEVAKSYVALGQADEARYLREDVLEEWQNLLKARQIDDTYPPLVTARINLAHNLCNLGEKGGATKMFKEVIELGKNKAHQVHRQRCEEKQCNEKHCYGEQCAALYCKNTHAWYNVDSAVDTLEHLVYIHYDAKDRQASEEAKDELLRIWDAKLKTEQRVPDYLLLRNRLASMVGIPKQRVQERERILEVAIRNLVNRDISDPLRLNLHGAASLIRASMIRDFDGLGDHASILDHWYAIWVADGQLNLPKKYEEAFQQAERAAAAIEGSPMERRVVESAHRHQDRIGVGLRRLNVPTQLVSQQQRIMQLERIKWHRTQMQRSQSLGSFPRLQGFLELVTRRA
ncbi:hypothetical protein PG994_007801 [Apiospora phragmitis]|uniref:NB-ARC domain-containing protein n=1 Tax=Apiospora phragmitis TaxID=2905665 RepID=A0ABR1UR82_9PEZI